MNQQTRNTKGESVRWGIIGCGNIAHNFLKAIPFTSNAAVCALASKTPGKASAMASDYKKMFPDIAVYTDYAEMLESNQIDAVYIATTHNFHYDNIRLCLNAGKHVLCEKPITINSAQLEELRILAVEKNCFMMEALWTRFLPGILKLKELLAENIIGKVHMLQANFGIEMNLDPQHRLMNRDLAGGALLDLGIYPLNFACIVYGSQPVKAESLAAIGETSVDELSAYLLRFSCGGIAVLTSSCAVQIPHTAVLYGAKGTITVKDFFHPSSILVETGNSTEEYNVAFPSSGFQYEIQESSQCILSGLMESSIHPLSESMGIMQLMDRFRRDWGLQYPGE